MQHGPGGRGGGEEDGKASKLEQREERWRDETEILPFLSSTVLVSAGKELPAHLIVASDARPSSLTPLFTLSLPPPY